MDRCRACPADGCRARYPATPSGRNTEDRRRAAPRWLRRIGPLLAAQGPRSPARTARRDRPTTGRRAAWPANDAPTAGRRPTSAETDIATSQLLDRDVAVGGDADVGRDVHRF